MQRTPRTVVPLFVAAAWSLALIGCATQGGEASGLSGRLIFGDHTTIGELALTSGALRIIERNAPSSHLAELGATVSRVDENTLVFDIRPRFGGDDTLHEMKIDTGASIILRSGAAPTFLPARRKIFFLMYERSPTQRYRLYVADYDDPKASAIRISDEAYITPYPVIPISANEVIISRSSTKTENAPLLYNVDSSSTVELPLPGCRPILWRAATQQLLCSGRPGSRGYYFTNLRGTEIASVKIGRGAIPVSYIAKHDTMIATVPRISLSETYDLYTFSFRTERWQKLLDRRVVFPGAATWVE